MKKIFTFLVLSLFIMPMFGLVLVADAGASNLDIWQGSDDQLEAVGFDPETDPRAVAVAVVNMLMGFLGLIAVVIVLLAGFKWMTSAGNEDKVAEAKKMLGAGVIGLVIIISSYGLARWLINSIVDVI